MKFLYQLFFRLGFATVMLGILSYVLPFVGLKFRNAGYLEVPGAKFKTILVGLFLIGVSFLISLVKKKRN